MPETSPSVRERILDAAFNAFMRLGYGGTSTAQIARLARVSKRDLYAHFGSKQAMLAGCVAERADRMRRTLTPSTPTDRDSLHRILIEFGIAVVTEISRPEVLATYRLAILEAENAPDVALTLDRQGRAANAQGLIDLLAGARARGLLDGEPADMAALFLGVLMSDGILVRMLMRVAQAPSDAEARNRAAMAAGCLLKLHGSAADERLTAGGP